MNVQGFLVSQNKAKISMQTVVLGKKIALVLDEHLIQFGPSKAKDSSYN
jgi:hypothetical protein